MQLTSSQTTPFTGRPIARLRRSVARRAAGTHLLSWLVLLLGLLLTGAAWWSVRDTLETAQQQRFRFQQAEVLHKIGERLHSYEQVLYGARGMLRASEQVSRLEWRSYVDSLEVSRRFPGIQGIGYTAWVRPDGLAALEARVRAEGFPAFDVWPEGPREAYTSILMLEPFDAANRRALGYDMWSEPVRRAAMQVARDTGGPAVSGKVSLVQDAGENEGKDLRTGFLMYLPYYGLPTPTTLEARQARLQGFVYAPFRMRDFIEAVEEDSLAELRLRLYSGNLAASDALIYDSAPDEAWPAHARTALASLQLPGQVWTAEFAAAPDFVSRRDAWTPPVVLGLGVAFSLLGFVAVRSGAAWRRAEQQNARLGKLIEDAASEVYVLNAFDLRFVQANRGARDNLGVSMAELRRTRLTDIQTEVDRRRFGDLSRPLRRGLTEQVTYETVHRRRDGTTYQAEVNLQLHRNARPPVYHALVQDVTRRKAQEEALTRALSEARGLLAEKETLLREVHHRVKNNLQVIWSLIRLEATDIKDAGLRERLEVVAQRISVLGQIHQQLYGTDNLARVDIGQHLRELAAGLAELHAHQAVRIEVEAEQVACDLETAIPLGLIANELISNSLEHAFPDGRPGRVVVRIGMAARRIRLEVADDGVGGPEPPARTGLGLKLVQALTSQLGAELEVERNGGTRTCIILPPEDCTD